MRLRSWLPRVAGLAAGISLAAVAVASWRVAPGTGTMGADVTFVAHAIGELDVTPLEPLVLGRDLRPAEEGEGQVVSLRNQTGSDLLVSVRATPAGRDLDDLLWVRLTAPGTELFRGSLGRLRSWSSGSLQLSSGASADLSLAAWLPASVDSGYQGRAESVELDFRVNAVGSRG